MKIEITANLPPETIKQIAEQCARIMVQDHQVVSGEEPNNYTTKEVAYLLNKSTATIQRHCDQGIMEATKRGKSWIITKENLKTYRDSKLKK